MLMNEYIKNKLDKLNKAHLKKSGNEIADMYLMGKLHGKQELMEELMEGGNNEIF